MKWRLEPANSADPLTRFSNFKWLATRTLAATVSSVAHLAHGRLLDVGCGERRFAPYLRPQVTKYVGLDYPTTYMGAHTHIDVFGSGLALPFPSASFDTVVCFEVLEHVTDPKLLASELTRVVRAGGTIILTVPFLWGEHCQPYDFQRFTMHGVRLLLEREGLVIDQQRRAGTFWTFFGQRFCYHLSEVYRGPRVRWMLSSLSFMVLAVASLLERLDPTTAEYAMSLVVATKPAGDSLAQA